MTIPEIHMKTVHVEVEKRRLLKPWKKKKVIEQWREVDKVPFLYKGEIVPVGFRWNGSSVPRLFWAIISPWKNPKASCWHDFKCGQIQIEKELADILLEKNTINYEEYSQRIHELEERRKVADDDYADLIGRSENAVVEHFAWSGTRLGSFLGYGW